MSNILDTARQLNSLKADFDMLIKFKLPEPLHLNKLLKELDATEAEHNDEKIDGIDELWKRVQTAFRLGRLITMPLVDKKSFPFLLSLAYNNNIQLYRFLMDEIRSIESVRLLRREIYVYFNDYDNVEHIVDLRSDIVKKLKAYKKHNRFLMCMKQNLFIFNPSSLGFIQKRCLEEGILEYFSSLRLPKSFLHSKYAAQVIKGIFSSKDVSVDLKEKLDLFTKNYEWLESSFVEHLPIIFASLITQIEAYNGNEKELYKEIIRPRALDFMKDPRLGAGFLGRWYAAGEKATNIFITWLSQYDLDAFFKIIGDSLVSYSAMNMWIYREKFWKSYRKHIQMVWVCYGKTAKSMANRANMSSGDYVASGQGNKSCILIVIGDYIFVERSHDGTLKVWKRKHSPFKIGDEKISESGLNTTHGIYHIKNGKPKDGWRHDGSSSYTWQTEVGSFIAQYMHVIKTVKDWRI